MDGVLIDTEKYLFRYWKQAATEAGYELSDQILLGMRSLASEFAVAANGVEKKPKVDELLDYLHAHGYKTAVATATDPKRAKQYLTSIGIYEKFDQVVCATMVPHGKPMPDVYLYVCEQIGEKPEECIAIEDSDNGVLSAYRAGCNVVMVPDLAGPKPETAELLTGFAENLAEVIPILERMQG